MKGSSWRRWIVLGMVLLAHLQVSGQVEVAQDTTVTPEVKAKLYFSEGLKFKMLGDKDQAIANFQKCIGIHPGSGSAFYELGLLYMEKKDYSAATGYARNAWKRDPQNKWYGMLLVENLIMQGKPAECVPVYRQLQKIDPNNEEFLTGEIQCLIQAGNYKEALRRVDELPQQGEMSRWAVVKKKDILFAGNKFKQGVKVLTDWLKENPGDLEVRGILAEAYAMKGLKAEAEAQYWILMEQYPDNPAVSFSLGQFYYQNNRKEEALSEFLKGFRSPDVNPSVKIEIIRYYLTSQGDQEKIGEPVRQLIEVMYQVDKGDPEVDELYANYLYSEEKLKEAEPLYRKLVRTSPGNFVLWQNLLFILNEEKRFDEILTVSDSALSYFPTQGLFHLFKGMAAIEKKNYELAITALNKGLSIPGQNAEVVKQFYLSLAEAQYRGGHPADAFRNFDQMLALEPDNVMVLNNYSYYLSLEGKELDKALEMIRKAVGKEPENPTFLDTWAWVLYVRGEYAAALEPMEKTIRLSAEPSGEVLEHYGDILYRNGRTAEAREAWIRARGKEGVTGGLENKISNGLK